MHQLVYLVAFGAAPGPAGHGYLEALWPSLLAAAAVALAGSLLVTALGRIGARPVAPSQPTDRAIAYAAALLAVFVAQELAEAVLAQAGLAALAAGGLAAVPVAIALGGLIAWLGGLLDRAEAGLARALAPIPAGVPPALGTRRLPALRPVAPLLAFGSSGRAPPALART
jgi:hypothetical protein